VTNELETLELEAQMDLEAPSAQHLPHPTLSVPVISQIE